MRDKGEISGIYLVGKYKVSPATRQVMLGDKRIDLPWRCCEGLLVLIEANGEVVERDVFFRRLWPNVTVEESSLNQAIARLRKELGETGDESIIATVPRRGYRLTHKPELLPDPAYQNPGEPIERAASLHKSWLRPLRSMGFALGIAALCLLGAVNGWQRWSKHRQALVLAEEGFRFVREGRLPQMTEATSRFSRAVELDPNLAVGYAGLAEAMARSVDGSRSHAKEMAERSLRIDPQCAECRGIAGWILMTYEWQFAKALRYLQAAARQAPQDPRIQLWYAQALACSGRLDEALQRIDQVVATQPTDAAPIAMKAGILYFKGHYEESMRVAQLSLGLRAGYTAANDWIYRSGMALGRIEEALEAKASLTAAFTGLSPDARHEHERRWSESYSHGGMRALVETLLTETSGGRALVENRYDRATLRMRIGDVQGALEELENVFEWRPFHCIYMGVDPALEPLRGEPRFHNVLAKIGLNEVLTGYKPGH